MVCGIFYYGLAGAGSAKINSMTAIGILIAFFVAGFAYLIGDSLLKNKPLFLPSDLSHPLRDRAGASKERRFIKVQLLTVTLALSPRRGNKTLTPFSWERRVGEGLPHFVRRAEDAHKSYGLFNPRS